MSLIFHAGGALAPDYPNYIERAIDRDAPTICDVPNKNYKYISVMAPRQMGKTSFLHRLAAGMREKGWTCCYISLDAINAADSAEWFERFGQELMRCIGSKESIVLKNERDLRAFLLDHIGVNNKEQPTRLALFLDEVEALESCPASDEFLLCLRAMYNVRFEYPGKLVAIFAGATDTSRLVQNTRVSPFNVAESLEIADFQEHETRQLTYCLDKLKIVLENGVHDRIFEWTSGQPYLTQRICEIIERRAQSGINEIEVADIDEIVHEYFIRGRSTDSNIAHIIRQASIASNDVQNLIGELLTRKTVLRARLGTYALYLTGIVSETEEEYYAIRNKIYQKVLQGIPTPLSPTFPVRNQVFISYSHRDSAWLDKIQIALRPKFRGTNIVVWDDKRIQIGDNWEDEINRALAHTKVAILLVSINFAASDFIYEKELPIILEAAEANQLRLVWIAVGPSDHGALGLTSYQCANDPQKPLKGLEETELDDNLVRIADFVYGQFDY